MLFPFVVTTNETTVEGDVPTSGTTAVSVDELTNVTEVAEIPPILTVEPLVNMV